jgi:hypothetical protein
MMPLLNIRKVTLLCLVSVAALSAQSFSTYDYPWMNSDSGGSIVGAYAQMTLDSYAWPYPATGVCLKLTSPNGFTYATNGSAVCPGYYVAATTGDNVQLYFDSNSLGNYTLSITYDMGDSPQPPPYNTVTHIIGVGQNGANYQNAPRSDGTCKYNIDCDSPPKCPNGPNWQSSVIHNDELPCDNYWVQQWGSVIYDSGPRTCFPMPQIWPYLSGKNSVRAACGN